MVPPPDPEALLDNWERGCGGGACFELADMFRRLLVALGYRAQPVLAQITFPGSHQAVKVEVDGRTYLAEVSNGSPFFEPIPLDSPFEIHRIGLDFRFGADTTAEHWVQERYINGVWERFCTYDLQPPDPCELESICQRHHTPGESWVMDRFRLIRCRENEIYSLYDGRLSHFTAAGKESQPVSDTECAPFVAGAFGMPGLPVQAALDALAERG
jgi:arylamine N-acetyltransferase